MQPLEFTCTHISQRTDILQKTIDSIVRNLNGVDFAKSVIYINIDSCPNEQASKECVSYLGKIFGRVIYNITEEPNFTKAIHWCWNCPKRSELFFHLEDDWILEKKIELKNLLNYFSDPNVYAVNLRAYHFTHPRPCLAQSIWRKSFCKDFLETLDFQRNPESQLRSFVKNKCNNYNIHFPEDINDVIIKDIGRKWLSQKGLKRNHISSMFIKYDRSN